MNNSRMTQVSLATFWWKHQKKYGGICWRTFLIIFCFKVQNLQDFIWYLKFTNDCNRVHSAQGKAGKSGKNLENIKNHEKPGKLKKNVLEKRSINEKIGKFSNFSSTGSHYNMVWFIISSWYYDLLIFFSYKRIKTVKTNVVIGFNCCHIELQL